MLKVVFFLKKLQIYLFFCEINNYELLIESNVEVSKRVKAEER